jgi:uncharacterized membrane protein (UPF0182 family)
MNKNYGIFLFIFIAVLLLVIAGSAVFHLYINWLFFDETGFRGVFNTILSTKIIAALLFSAVFLVFYLLNIYFANKINFPLRNLHLFGDTVYPIKTFFIEKPVKLITSLGVLFIAFLIALFGASKWERILLLIRNYV